MKTYLLTRRGKRGCGGKVVSFGFLCWAPFGGKGPKKQGKRCIEYFLGPKWPLPPVPGACKAYFLAETKQHAATDADADAATDADADAAADADADAAADADADAAADDADADADAALREPCKVPL